MKQGFPTSAGRQSVTNTCVGDTRAAVKGRAAAAASTLGRGEATVTLPRERARHQRLAAVEVVSRRISPNRPGERPSIP